MSGTLEDKRAKLKSMVALEDKINHSRATVDRHSNISLVALPLEAERAVPCLLHMEMRLNEKVFWTLLAQGMDRYQDKDGKTRKLFVAQVTEYMRSSVSSQWQFPLKDGSKQVEPRSMTGTHGERCARGIKTLATIVFCEELDECSAAPNQVRECNENCTVAGIC